MKRATRAVAAVTLVLSVALGAGACTEIAGDFQISEKACLFWLDCPDTSECAVPTCTDHLCGSTPVARGTVCTPGCPYYNGCGPCTGQPRCGQCDGKGHCLLCETAADCFMEPNECASVACVQGQCEVQPAPIGWKCSTGVCTMNSTCGECNYPADCPDDATCVKATNECCRLSPAACTADADCCSNHCSAGTCACLTGAEGLQCKADENCCSNKCVDQFCVP